MNFYSFSVLVFAICSFLLGAQIYLSRRDEIGLRYFICSIFYSGWGIGYAFAVSGNIPYSEALIHFRISNTSAAFIPCAWLHFCLIYTDHKVKPLQLISLYIFPILILIRCFSMDLVPYLRPSGGFLYYPAPGVLFFLETAIYFVLVPAAFFFLLRYFKKTVGEERQKLLGFITVSFSGYVGGAFTFFPVYGIQVPQWSVFLLPLYPFGLAYFISTRGLLNLENLVAIAHKDKLAALGILTASINHEIRAPLFVMRGVIESGLNESSSQKILNQIDRITSVVSRLSHFAKKGVDEEAKIEPLELVEILADIQPLFQHQLHYQQIEYSSQIPTKLPKIMADRRYFEEILFNLILNACQAVKDKRNGKVTICAKLEKSEVIIQIKDNGPGFTVEQIKNIFKPFHTTKEEGTGLGLYITKQLIEKCGGKIEIEPNKANITQFNIYLKI